MFDASLYIDVDRPGGQPCLLDGKASAAIQAEPTMAQADEFLLKLFFRRRGVAGTNSTAVQLDAGAVVILAAKHVDELGSETLLFSEAGFTKEGTGDDLHYEAVLSLNTDELTAKIGNNKTIPVRIDVEVQNAGNTRRLTYQFDLTVSHQVYGGEADPTPGTPPYPHPDLIVQKIRGTVDLADDEDEVEVTGLGLDEAPAQVLLTIRKPSAAAPLIVCGLVGDPTDDGFTVALSAEPGIEGYKLDYLVIP